MFEYKALEMSEQTTIIFWWNLLTFAAKNRQTFLQKVFEGF